MSVSYYQLMFLESEGSYRRVSLSRSTSLYQLPYLVASKVFRRHIEEIHDYTLYDFTSNLKASEDMPPSSDEYIDPQDIVQDLGMCENLLVAIEGELQNPDDRDLQKEIRSYEIDEPMVQWIREEIKELLKVCIYALEKGYFIKYACDY